MPTLTRNRPTLEVSVDFAANPTARYADIHTTDDGVVSFWRLNSTTTLLDELGVNNGVQISTGTLVSGPYPYDSDQAVSYDGTNDSAYVVSSMSLVKKEQQSVDGWCKFASFPGATRDFVSKRGSWVLKISSTGIVSWTVKDDTSIVTVTAIQALLTGTWHHITGVYDDEFALLYIDGVLAGASAYTGGAELSPQPIRFAADPYATAPTWQSSTTNTGSSTSAVGNAPASIASGDLLIAHVGFHTASGAADITAIPTGWELLNGQKIADPTGSYIYAKVATGSEPGTYTWTLDTSSSWNVAVTRITGWDTVAMLANPSYGISYVPGASNKTSGPHIANVANSLRLDFVYSRSTTAVTFSSGTERYDFQAGNSLAMASQVPGETSVEQTITSGASNGAGQTVHISGTGVNEVAVQLKDWTYWNRALTADDVGRNYWSKDSGTPTWTDVTLEVRNMQATLPERRYELDMLVNGTMSMTLREVGDKDFDPTNTSSPYGPDILQRSRVRATWNSTTYNVFRGYAEAWTPVRLGGDQDEVAFSAVDGFDLLARAPVSGVIPVGYSGAHINAILDKALWPLADRSIDTGQYVMNGYTLSEGALALSMIQEIAASERGVFFIDAAGVATFHDAAHRGSQSRSTTSQATFSDWPGGPASSGKLDASTEIRYQGIQPTRDKDKIVNIWTVTPDSGVFGAAPQTVIDHESRARYGPASSSKSSRLATNADAEDQAGNLLTDTAFPADRYEYMRVIPLTIESYDKCLDLRVSDRITVKRGQNPGYDGAAITRDYFIEGKDINVADKRSAWQFTFVLTPVSSGNYYQTIMRDEPVSYWRMDTIT